VNLKPLLEASLSIQLHTAGALLAVGLTIAILAMRKGSKTHKTLGRIWVVTMALVALSSFRIHGFNLLWGFSPIHILSVFVLYRLAIGIIAIRKGDVEKHKHAMVGVAIGGLGIAGAFTFYPGRIMYQIFFG